MQKLLVILQFEEFKRERDKFKKTIKLFYLTTCSFPIVYSFKMGFIIPLGINDSNGTGSHCKLQK